MTGKIGDSLPDPSPSHHPLCTRCRPSPLRPFRDRLQMINNWDEQGFPEVARDFPKRFPYFLKKLLKSCTKNNQKLLFLTKVAQKMLQKAKTFLGLMLKDANCTTKVRFLSIFVKLCGVTSVAKKTLSSTKTKKRNEPIKLLNDLLHPRHSSQQSVNLRPPF